MTCRDLIIYILENGLEDEPVVINGVPVGFMSVEQAAVTYGVGNATIRAQLSRGMLDKVCIGDKLYIPKFKEVKKCSEK